MVFNMFFGMLLNNFKKKVQLINKKYFLPKKGQTFPLVKISFLKDIDSLDLLHFMQLCRIWQHCIV